MVSQQSQGIPQILLFDPGVTTANKLETLNWSIFSSASFDVFFGIMMALVTPPSKRMHFQTREGCVFKQEFKDAF
jgi:hypothetical protein